MKTHALTKETVDAVKATMKTGLEDGRWTPAKSGATIISTLETLDDERGKPVTLTDEEKQVIEGICNATVKSRLATIRYVLSQRNVTLDAEFEALIAKFFNPSAVQKQVESMRKPEKRTLRELIA